MQFLVYLLFFCIYLVILINSFSIFCFTFIELVNITINFFPVRMKLDNVLLFWVLLFTKNHHWWHHFCQVFFPSNRFHKIFVKNYFTKFSWNWFHEIFVKINFMEFCISILPEILLTVTRIARNTQYSWELDSFTFVPSNSRSIARQVCITLKP